MARLPHLNQWKSNENNNTKWRRSHQCSPIIRCIQLRRRDKNEPVNNESHVTTCRHSRCCRWNQFYLILLQWWIYVCDNNRALGTYCVFFLFFSFIFFVAVGFFFFTSSHRLRLPCLALVQKCVPLFCSRSLMVCFIILMMCLMHAKDVVEIIVCVVSQPPSSLLPLIDFPCVHCFP